MAQLIVENDIYQPGRWTLRSDNPSVLAAVPDAIIQVLGLENDVLSAWAVHYDEQNEYAENAYANERREIGYGPAVEVISLPRAAQPHVVWIDRQHLVVGNAAPPIGTRLLGLYAGSNGTITLALSDPSVAGQVHATLREFVQGTNPFATADHLGANDAWGGDPFVGLNRFVLRYDALSKYGESPTNVLHVRAPQPMALAVQGALGQLQQMVAGW